jgi:hypothetical protein
VIVPTRFGSTRRFFAAPPSTISLGIAHSPYALAASLEFPVDRNFCIKIARKCVVLRDRMLKKSNVSVERAHAEA